MSVTPTPYRIGVKVVKSKIMKRKLLVALSITGYATMLIWTVIYSVDKREKAKIAHSIKADSINNAKSVEYFVDHSEIKP